MWLEVNDYNVRKIVGLFYISTAIQPIWLEVFYVPTDTKHYKGSLHPIDRTPIDNFTLINYKTEKQAEKMLVVSGGVSVSVVIPLQSGIWWFQL